MTDLEMKQGPVKWFPVKILLHPEDSPVVSTIFLYL